MAAMPLGMVIGAFLLGRVAAPSARIRMQALRPGTRARAFGVAQSGLCAVQGLGILVGGAQAIGVPLAVDLAGLVGVTATTIFAMSWTHLRGRLIMAQRGEAEALGA
jgi:hypothetical protein